MDSRREFLDRIHGALEALRSSLHRLRNEEGTEDSLRRICRSIGRVAGEMGLDDIRSLALEVERANARPGLVSGARALATSLEKLQKAAYQRPSSLLVVEDDPVLATLLKSALEEPDRDILTVESAGEARTALGETVFDLLLLDLMLPDADGRDFLLELRETPEFADIPIIVLSGLSANRAKGECLALGADDYLQKPVDPPLARLVVAAHLAAGRVGEDDVRTGPMAGPGNQAGPNRDQEAREERLSHGRTRRVMLVEDDDLTAKLMIHRLSRDDFDVVHLTDGKAAFEVAQEDAAFSLAIFDVKLPGMDGFELLQRVKELPGFSRIPVIMLTSMGREADVVRAFDLGAKDYVLKPFSPPEVAARIRRILGEEEPGIQ
jgi:DNA-binding response OmpR family regulator